MNEKKIFKPFDFYYAFNFFFALRGRPWDDLDLLMRANYSENLLKLSDYGITDSEVDDYVQLVMDRRAEAMERHVIYGHRSNFFKVLVVLFLIYVLFFINALLFSILPENAGWFLEDLCVGVCVGLIWVLYRYVYRCFAFIIDSTQEKIERLHAFPKNGRPDGYNPRIEKYFNDLLWKLYLKTSH